MQFRCTLHFFMYWCELHCTTWDHNGHVMYSKCASSESMCGLTVCNEKRCVTVDVLLLYLVSALIQAYKVFTFECTSNVHCLRIWAAVRVHTAYAACALCTVECTNSLQWTCTVQVQVQFRPCTLHMHRISVNELTAYILPALLPYQCSKRSHYSWTVSVFSFSVYNARAQCSAYAKFYYECSLGLHYTHTVQCTEHTQCIRCSSCTCQCFCKRTLHMHSSLTLGCICSAYCAPDAQLSRLILPSALTIRTAHLRWTGKCTYRVQWKCTG